MAYHAPWQYVVEFVVNHGATCWCKSKSAHGASWSDCDSCTHRSSAQTEALTLGKPSAQGGNVVDGPAHDGMAVRIETVEVLEIYVDAIEAKRVDDLAVQIAQSHWIVVL